MGRAVAAIVAALSLVSCGVVRESTPETRVEWFRSTVVSWCDGPDKLWGLSTLNGEALAVVPDHPECAR